MKNNLYKLAVILTFIGCFSFWTGCQSGGGSGSGESDDINSQNASAIVGLNEDAQNGLVTQEQFLSELESILKDIDAEANGPSDFITYLETDVVGDSVSAHVQSSSVHRAATLSETLANIKNSTTYLMLETFVTSVASSLLLPDPVSMILDLAKPEVFTSMASALVRVQTYDAMINGDIDVLTGNEIAGEIQNNPFDAERDLLAAKGETIPEWLESYNDVCMWDCISSNTGNYSGPFSGTMTETGLGCVWQHSLSGTIELTVTGNGTLADPYDGTFDLSGNIVTVLNSGIDCDSGGSAPISYFSGTVSGSSGKLEASGNGEIGTATFMAILSNGTVSTTTISGSFYFDFGVDNDINQTVTLTKH